MISSVYVSVVAPIRDDVDLIEDFVRDLLGVLSSHYSYYEVILVDDGSTDGSTARIKGLLETLEGIRLIRLSRAFGQEIAISAGLDSAIGDYVVVMLPQSDPPALIPEIVEQSRQGPGILYGVKRSRKGEPLARRLFVSVFFWYCNRILGLNIPTNATHFRVLSRQAVNAVTQIRDQMRYLHSLSAFVGYENQNFVYEPIPRRTPQRVSGLWDSLQLALNIIVSNSTQPLRFVSWLGVVLSAANAGYAVFLASVLFFGGGTGDTVTTLSLQTSVMFFFLFLVLSTLSEYVNRVLRESVERPLYFVQGELKSAKAVQSRENVVEESIE